jgi:hypothetical protein
MEHHLVIDLAKLACPLFLTGKSLGLSPTLLVAAIDEVIQAPFQMPDSRFKSRNAARFRILGFHAWLKHVE